ncbi:uncharacterized protein PV09_00505 [Verruconis gallopava]|uniref:Uncharacterized protein n=1 Tax=Verruconis gallopava TaxID=253628 RepID=A0A0D1Z6H6_9PEZI|nr:uncharacterized protein PV09_00505 [Verruconis gallopava]KIW08537.1 hypothetical protein PV09_00505 [Verruconis gallopava]
MAATMAAKDPLSKPFAAFVACGVVAAVAVTDDTDGDEANEDAVLGVDEACAVAKEPLANDPVAAVAAAVYPAAAVVVTAASEADALLVEVAEAAVELRVVPKTLAQYDSAAGTTWSERNYGESGSVDVLVIGRLTEAFCIGDRAGRGGGDRIL